MTGYAEHIEKARQLGVTVLSKPFNADDFATQFGCRATRTIASAQSAGYVGKIAYRAT
jgi:hypothetical protein